MRVKTQKNTYTVKYGSTLWNNPNRTCEKVAGYFHDKEAAFADANLSDAQCEQLETKALLLAKGQRSLKAR